ncbi:hypothetical protein E4U54_005553 [Claviceps lovelessii]|nr:hypothetical protein E4U54_005553 [Claviceps lovelessii]
MPNLGDTHTHAQCEVKAVWSLAPAANEPDISSRAVRLPRSSERVLPWPMTPVLWEMHRITAREWK